MTTALKFQRGSTSENSTTTLSQGEIFVDISKNALVVHDGSTAGGTTLATEAFASQVGNGIVGAAPNDLNTLQEIAAAIDNDANFANTVSNQLDNKVGFTDLSATGDLTYTSSTGVFSVTTYKSTDFNSDFAAKTTTDLTEGANLYYTDAKVDSHLSGGTGVAYSAGVISIGQSVSTGDDVAFNSVTLGSAPSSDTDAATKSYVDSVAQGITTRPSARATTTQDLNATYSAGTLTANANGAFETDDVTGWSIGEEVLVKDQTDATENGVYVVSTVGDASNPFVLDRADFADESAEIAGSFVFVTEGTEFSNSGWVLVVDDAATFTLDTDDITVNQFSGAGTFTAGAGLDLTGSEFSVNVGDGIEIAGDALRLPSTLAGNGLQIGAGVLTVDLSVFSTSNLSEGSRLYYTEARANSAIDARVNKTFVDALNIDADTLDGNDSNFYLNYNNLNNTPVNLSGFNNDTDYITLTDLTVSGDLAYDNTTGELSVTTYKSADFDTDFSNKTTDDLTEGANQYFTGANVDAYLSAGTGVTYNSGEISIGQPVATTDSVIFDEVTATGGITFTTPLAADTTLDQYEVGTWTPAFQSVNQATGRSTTVFRADYTRIGNTVTCTFAAELGSLGSGGSGAFVISGLPFTGTGNGIFQPSFFDNLASAVSYMSGAVQASTGRVLVTVLPAADTGMNNTPEFTDFVQEGTRIDGTVIYFVD